MRSVDPGRIEGLEIFSTVLWHLRKEVDLCYLAQQAMELERTAWQCSCVVGNCFALQKEHEAALKFFQRAMQVAPGEPYAHTLAGHEHLANEDFDRALDSYRAAIRADERHYNAWYGLGYVYYRQEKYDLAEYVRRSV
jgi:anaphase-promoting complex subunit 3